MPVFNIKGADKGNGFGLVFATMLIPNDIKARDLLIKRIQTEVRIEHFSGLATEGIIKLSPIEKMLLDCANLFKSDKGPSTKNAMLYGFIAGSILGSAVGCALTPGMENHGSVGKAIKNIALTDLRRAGAENIRQNVWPKFRSVSHLWAAFGGFGFKGWNDGVPDKDDAAAHLGLDHPREIQKLKIWELKERIESNSWFQDLYRQRFDVCRKQFDEFLALAEILRLVGVGLKPLRSKETVLNAKETWRIPKGHPAIDLIPQISERLSFEPAIW